MKVGNNFQPEYLIGVCKQKVDIVTVIYRPVRLAGRSKRSIMKVNVQPPMVGCDCDDNVRSVFES